MRPDILNPLFAEVEALKGIGPQLAKPLHRLGLDRVVDLLFHLPGSWIDRKRVMRLDEADVVAADASGHAEEQAGLVAVQERADVGELLMGGLPGSGALASATTWASSRNATPRTATAPARAPRGTRSPAQSPPRDPRPARHTRADRARRSSSRLPRPRRQAGASARQKDRRTAARRRIARGSARSRSGQAAARRARSRA